MKKQKASEIFGLNAGPFHDDFYAGYYQQSQEQEQYEEQLAEGCYDC